MNGRILNPIAFYYFYKVKNLGIFYLIFMVMLSALPCNDEMGEKDPNPPIAKVEQKKSQETENCSPICLCACCGQSVLVPYFVALTIKVQALSKTHQFANTPFALATRAQMIWQPPQLV